MCCAIIFLWLSNHGICWWYRTLPSTPPRTSPRSLRNHWRSPWCQWNHPSLWKCLQYQRWWKQRRRLLGWCCFFLDSWIPANWKKIKNTHCYVLFCILSWWFMISFVLNKPGGFMFGWYCQLFHHVKSLARPIWRHLSKLWLFLCRACQRMSNDVVCQ